MTGRITGISGPTVIAKAKGLSLFDRVYVGKNNLTGEVVRLEGDNAIIQVYEDTRGLGTGEPVKSSMRPLTVRFGPGLLGNIFDGLQRPLERLREDTGPLITYGKEIYSLDYMKKWRFTPLRRKGEDIKKGDILGYFDEMNFKHYIISQHEGKISWLIEGEVSLNEFIGEFEDNHPIFGCHEWSVRTPRPVRKKLHPSIPLITGQRIIDFLFPLAKGGTAIIPGGFGTGKTVLEQSIAKFADIDIVIYVGCGERGNEMAEMIEEFFSLKDPWKERRLMDRTILVVNTSNMPVAAREASIYTAVSMAEYYRDMGFDVLLLADSLSRWAEALREISSSLEEMPGEEGYPTYLASRLAQFFERAGYVETLCGKRGSLSMILSVSPPGGDFTEPVTQACLRTAGAFLMLDTSLAHRRHFPAINWFQSYSLYSNDLAKYFQENVSEEWNSYIKWCGEMLEREESLREIVEIVGMEGLQDSDRLLMHVTEKIRTEFLAQNAYTDDAFSPPLKTLSIIKSIKESYDKGMEYLTKGIPIEDVLNSSSTVFKNSY